MWALGRHEEALEEQCAALAIRLDVLVERHPDVATSRNNIGSSLRALGRHEEALDEQRAALAILLDVLGERHPDVAEGAVAVMAAQL